MKLFDVGKVVSSSIGMAAAMSLSSLFLWKSDWLSVPSGAFYGSHGVGIAIGVVVSAVAMLWCTLSRRSLRHFGMGVVPCVALASLLVSGLPMVEGTAQWVLGIAIPVAGSYALVFSWLYVISLRDIEVSLMALLLAWVVSFFARTFFESFTGAAVTLAISTALMAASWILLLAQNRQIDLASPMATCSFADNRVSYIHGLGSFWRSVLYCGAFAFLGGVVRFLSIGTTAMTFVNYGSALAGLFAPIALMLLWRFRTVRYTIDGVFRLAFPLIVVALGALPFAYGTPLVVAAALLYMIYSFLSLSVQILAVQVSHDYGIDPVFCLSFQTLVCVAAQGLGYLLGALAPCGTAFDVSPYVSGRCAFWRLFCTEHGRFIPRARRRAGPSSSCRWLGRGRARPIRRRMAPSTWMRTTRSRKRPWEMPSSRTTRIRRPSGATSSGGSTPCRSGKSR